MSWVRWLGVGKLVEFKSGKVKECCRTVTTATSQRIDQPLISQQTAQHWKRPQPETHNEDCNLCIQGTRPLCSLPKKATYRQNLRTLFSPFPRPICLTLEGETEV